MANMKDNKMILLNIRKLLLEKTDKAHPVTTEGIIHYLNHQGYEVENRAVINDIEILREFGDEIFKLRTMHGYMYYHGSPHDPKVVDFDNITL